MCPKDAARTCLMVAASVLIAACGGGGGDGSGSSANDPTVPPPQAVTHAMFIPAPTNGIGSEAGQSVVYGAGEANISASCETKYAPCDALLITIAPTSAYSGVANKRWTFEFGPPPASAVGAGNLSPGTYGTGVTLSEGVPFQPSFLATYDNETCDQITGWFKILELEPSASAITKLSMDFALQCSPGASPTWGAIRINSTIPLERGIPFAVAGSSYAQLEIEPIALSGSQSYSLLGALKSYHWEQTAGPPGTLQTPDQAQTSFVPAAPVPLSGASFSFHLVVTDTDGMADSDDTSIFVQSNSAPINLFHLDAGNEFDGRVLNLYSLPSNQLTRSNFTASDAYYQLHIDGSELFVPAVSDIVLDAGAAPFVAGQTYYWSGAATGEMRLTVEGVGCAMFGAGGHWLVQDVAYEGPNSDVISSAWIEFWHDCAANISPVSRDHGFILINHPIPPSITSID
jgi:hypothetical protein